MLPGPLLSTYERYKQDTDSVAAWLASTAKACGYSADLLTAVSQAPAATKPGYVLTKKQAKKLAASQAGAPGTARKYIIAIKDFVPLADFIAAFEKPPIRVPPVFTTTLDRVIALRSQYSANLGKAGVVDAKSDARHSHFVGILEHVRDALRPRSTTVQDTSKPGATAGPTLSNSFAALKVDEPSQAFLDAPDVERPTPADNARYETEPLVSPEDLLMAYALIVDDLNALRSQIKSIWFSYSHNGFDLATAAIATNSAIDLARSMTASVDELFSKQGGLSNIALKYHGALCLTEGRSPQEVAAMARLGESFLHETYDAADRGFFVAHSLLDAIKPVLDGYRGKNGLPLYQEGMYGLYDPSRNREQMSGRQKYQQDKIVLTEFFTELMASYRVRDYPVEDEFMRGFRELAEKGKTPFYLVFAAQTFLDIHHTLGAKTTGCFSTMMRQMNAMVSDIDSFLDFHQDLKIQTWPASNDRQMQMLKTRIEYIGTDPVHTAKLENYRAIGRVPGSTMRPHRMLQYSPVISGLMLFHFRAQMYDSGIAAAGSWGSIQFAAHLENALQREGLLTGIWRDMQCTFAMKGDDIFVGDTPRDIEDYYKKFCLQLGVSVSAFGDPRKRRKGGRVNLHSKAGPKGIQNGLPVSSMFYARYLENRASMNWTADDIEKIVARSEFEEDPNAPDEIYQMNGVMDPERLKQIRADAGRKGKSKAAPTLTDPSQLISRLTKALQAETLEMAWPFFEMHQQCWKLFRSVKDSCDPILRELFTAAYLEKETELPTVVAWIFHAASAQYGPTDLRPMRAAADAMNQMIRSGRGRTVLNMAMERLGIQIMFDDAANDIIQKWNDQ